MTQHENTHNLPAHDLRFRALTDGDYDPLKGIGSCGARVMVDHPAGGRVNIPTAMMADDDYNRAVTDPTRFDRLRTRYDFEFWCTRCCHIQDKTTGLRVPFTLNKPQRYVVDMFEEDRVKGRPIRLIMLKARQWGGSTLVQMYMAWIQCTQLHNWHSLICAHVKDTSSSIRKMYTDMLADYPLEMWLGDEGSKPGFKPFERSGNVREIPGRGCRVTVASSENQDAVRGANYAMAHLSEVAFWADTTMRSPADFMRAISGSINLNALTMIVMESTANGVGNFFHKEWLRACAGESDKRPVFIPWYYINIYSLPVNDPEEITSTLDDYERDLMDLYGCTVEQVSWYRSKLKEIGDHSKMKAEYPTNDVEAFTNTGYAVFAHENVNRLAADCRPPLATGDMTGPVVTGYDGLVGMRFEPASNGQLSVWAYPSPDAMEYESRYIVVVDIGGRSDRSDYSVIAVFDRVSHPGSLEVVAQWRGHCDHDLLAWKAAAIARWYGNAHLVYESNTLETDNTEGDPSLFILNDIAYCYGNLYQRRYNETGQPLAQPRPGFHTNRSTKTGAITRLNAALRDHTLIERDRQACNELLTYRYMPNGSCGAMPGCHDDIVITRAIAFAVLPGLPEADCYREFLASRPRLKFG